MTQVGNVYGTALYTLALEEQLTGNLLEELSVLSQCFRENPDFIRLLCSPNLPKQERCQVLDDSFRGKVHIYVLNFLKILTEKGYMKHFHDCFKTFEDLFNHDNGILPVTAITAIAMSEEQVAKLAEKLSRATAKQVKLLNQVDPSVLGGVRLDYDGKRLDDTVSHRMDAITKALKGTVL